MKNKNIFWLIGAGAIIAVCWFYLNQQKKSTKQIKTISIISIVKIDPITQLEEGFKKGIKNSEFAKNDSILITYDNAQ